MNKTTQGVLALIFLTVFYGICGIFNRLINETLTFYSLVGGLLILISTLLPNLNGLIREKNKP